MKNCQIFQRKWLKTGEHVPDEILSIEIKYSMANVIKWPQNEIQNVPK